MHLFTNPLTKLTFLLSFPLLICLITSCSSPLHQRTEYLSAYHHGNFPHTEASLTQTIEQAMPQNDYKQSKDATWMLLDRATTRFAMGNIQGAIQDYQTSIEALDYYNQDCLAESLGTVLLEDSTGAYIAEDYEQILARVYFALALLHQGDSSNAFAMLRQAEELQQEKRERYIRSRVTEHYQLIDNALGKYLFATLLEKRNDLSNASILYQQAFALMQECSPQQTQLQRDLTRLEAAQEKKNDAATLIILCHNGNVPYKVSTTTDASVASAVALEILLSSQRIDPAISCLGGVPTPALCSSPLSFPRPTYVCLDGDQKQLLPWYLIAATAQQQLDQKMPVIVARAVARYLIRRSTVAYAQKQDPTLGALVDFGMLIANANTKADTRSWATLPYAIDLARYEVDPGPHQLIFQSEAAYGVPPFFRSVELILQPNDLCIIHLFNIHPGMTTVQIPERFLIKGDNNDD